MDLGKQIGKGALWMLLFKFTDRGLMLISTAILARLLMPSDFGLVAMAWLFVAFLELLRSVGFDLALIQNQDAERKHFDTAWTFYVACGFVSAAGLLLLATPFARLFDEPRLVGVLALLALGSLVEGFENIGVVAFRKDLTFDREFRYLMGKRLVAFGTTVALAFLLRNYWALVAGGVLGRMAGVALSYAVHPYRPKFCLAGGRELFHFSKWMLLNGATSYIHTHSTHFVLGGVGSRPLGLFSVSEQLARLPITEVILPINRAVFPGYAKLTKELHRLRGMFLGVVATVALFAIPAGVGIAAVAELLTSVILGPKWIDAIPVIQLLALSGTISAISSNVYFVYVATGQVRAFWILNSLYALVLLPLIILLSLRYAALGAGLAHLLAAVLCFPLLFGAAGRLLEFNLRQLSDTLWRPTLAALAMYVAVRSCSELVTYRLADGFALALLVGLGASLYCLLLLMFWALAGKPEGPEAFVIERSGEVLTRWRGHYLPGRVM